MLAKQGKSLSGALSGGLHWTAPNTLPSADACTLLFSIGRPLVICAIYASTVPNVSAVAKFEHSSRIKTEKYLKVETSNIVEIKRVEIKRN